MSSAGKMEDWTGYIFFLFSCGAFISLQIFYGLTFRGQTSRYGTLAGIMSSLAEHHVCIFGLFLLLSMLDALFSWVDSVEKEGLMAVARGRFFFCSINEFLLLPFA